MRNYFPPRSVYSKTARSPHAKKRVNRILAAVNRRLAHEGFDPIDIRVK